MQLAYSQYQDPYMHGMKADINPFEIDCLAAEGAVGFGVVVQEGTTPGVQCKIGAASWAAALGISLRDASRQANNVGDTTLSYDDKELVNFARRGKIAVTLAAGGTAGAAIKFSTTTGVIDVGTAGGGEAQITNARLEKTVAAGGVGVIRFNIA